MALENETLDEARALVEALRDSLPVIVDVAALGVREKAPYNLLSVREALAWRTEELGRSACDMLAREDIAAGIILTRAVVESSAFIWRLKELLEGRKAYQPDELAKMFFKMNMGWKGEKDFPEAVNILTIIKHMEKRIPGILQRYNHLSEYAHPNWSGVSGLYSETDHHNFITRFGREFERRIGPKNVSIIMLASGLSLFNYSYNKISDEIPKYLEELTPF